MIYQLPLNLSLLLILVDFGLSVWVLISWKWEKWKTLSRIASFILFCGFSMLKWIGISPTFLASSPNELIFKSNDEIGRLHFARQDSKELFIFWEEKFSKEEGSLTLEMEGIYPSGLIIFTEIENSKFELRPKLEIEGDTWEPIVVELKNSDFRPISKEGAKAWENYKITTWANYASHFFSFAFLTVFLITSFNKPMENLTIT